LQKGVSINFTTNYKVAFQYYYKGEGMGTVWSNKKNKIWSLFIYKLSTSKKKSYRSQNKNVSGLLLATII